MGVFGFLLLGLIASISFFWYKTEQQKQRKRLEDQKNWLDYYLPHLENIHAANASFHANTHSFDKGYFTQSILADWKKSYAGLRDVFNEKHFESCGLPESETEAINQFLNFYESGQNLREKYNKEFISSELKRYKDFFDNIEGRKLDTDQRIAIISDEDNSIVIAGAGSGKTTTIVGKVAYITDRYAIPADQILLISFTNKSASDLADRIRIPGIEVKTFHKFGKDVITQVEDSQPSIFDEKQFKARISGFFQELLREPEYIRKATTFFTNFLKPIKTQDEFKTQGAYIQYLKDLDFSTYRLKPFRQHNRTTYKREVVKSIEECRIANFLLFNGLKYEYEYPYEHDTNTSAYRQYKPDFTLFDGNRRIYIEHFAINKNGTVPPFFADEAKGETLQEATTKYKQGIEWKRSLHTKYNTVLIETYSHEMADDKLFDKLSKRLTEVGIKLHPKPPEEIWQIINQSAKEEVENLIMLFQSFISLMKSNNYSIEDVEARNSETKNSFLKQRNKLFLDILSPIYQKYQQLLASRKEIDFSDMINKAVSYIATGRYNRKFNYVIIDEFQDISIGRYQLVKAIKESNPGCKLFCVGDDWQSIYRFSGSDLALFKEFDKYFGYTVNAKIETTYRFHNPLLSISSAFILKNPNQSKKQLRGFSAGKSTQYKIVYTNTDNQDDSYAIKEIFDELLLSGKSKGKTVQVLGRYSFDFDRVKNEDGFFHIDKEKEIINYACENNQGETLTLSAQFMTVHKAKGLEADFVIILNCNSGKYGFPSGVSDDEVLNLLLSEADKYENGEERRLFYVAMTRAKECVYFVTDSYLKSKFITELELGVTNATIRKCPKCKTADLVLRKGVKNGKEWAFYGCSNYHYGCAYQEWV
jgi:DNA helicase-4